MTGKKRQRVLVRGAGVSGLAVAVTLAERGASVVLHEAGAREGSGASWLAGGMLAPWCEGESAPDEITRDSLASVDWWRERVASFVQNGTLVVAPARDAPELGRFGRRTTHFETVDAARLAALEPDLEGRFDKGLFFPDEGHVDPRKALAALRARFEALGGSVRLETAGGGDASYDWTVDCRGIAARPELAGMRGVRGEMLFLRCCDIQFQRPVRLLHPRIPVYIVPRGDGLFMVGATMVETDDTRGITLRSMTELLNAAYTLHPAFADAEILESHAGLRPSFADNIPRVIQDGRTIHLNGMYRHGFLLAPMRAQQVANIVFGEAQAQSGCAN